MPFYHGDWKKDIGVQALSLHDRAVWLELLMLMHDADLRGELVLNNKPMSRELIARVISVDNQTFEASLGRILENGVCSIRENGTIYSRRMVRDREIATKRYLSGSKGGNPILVNKVNKVEKKKKAPRISQAIGHPPNPDNDNLPQCLIDIFKSENKLEQFKNIWITDAQCQRLLTTWGEKALELGMRALSQWSINHDINPKTKLAGWESYRLKRDHASALDNLLKRMEARSEF